MPLQQHFLLPYARRLMGAGIKKSTRSLLRRPMQFFMFQQPHTNRCPLLHAIWNDEHMKGIPLDTRERTPEQIAKLDKFTIEISTGMLDLIAACKPHKAIETRGVIVTPEYSMAAGLPLSELQLEDMIKTLFEYLHNKNKDEPWDFHFASVFVHLTGSTRLFQIKADNSDSSLDILNVALIGRGGDIETPRINVYYKQLTAAQDIFNEHSRHQLTGEGEVDLQRLMHTSTEGVMVGELCLESKRGLAFEAVAKSMCQGIMPRDSVGYHVLSSDTILTDLSTAAFPVYAHCDARMPPKILLVDDSQQDAVSLEKEVPILKTVTIDSSSSRAACGTITIFTPVELQPACARVIELNELLKAAQDPSPPS